ncbi:hypothetical protein AgCh_015707 [Apium graveolens]
MKVYMQAHGVWDAVEPKETVEDRMDKIFVAAIYQGIPEDILLSLAEKKMAKEACEAVKIMCQGAERVKKAKVQTLKAEFEGMSMKETESLDDFCMKLTGLVTNIRALGEEISESYIVKKLLRAVPSKFLQIASTLEQFGNLDTMTVEETVGSLKAYEERKEKEEGKILLIKEEWLKQSNIGESESGQKFQNNSEYRSRYKIRGGRDKSKVRCFNCSTYGHFVAEYRKQRCEREIKEEANIALMPDDEPTLLLTEYRERNNNMLLINEEQVVPKLNKGEGENQVASNLWYLDNGARNQMTGQRSKFHKLDENVTGQVKFGDGSVVHIKGRGSILVKCKNGESRLLREVFYIPTLCNDIISLGQLSGEGNKVVLNGDLLWIYGKQGELIMKVKRWWRVDPKEVCDGCLMAKQARKPFPAQANYSTKNPLELDEAFKAFKKFRATVEDGQERKILAFRTDRGGEFMTKEFITYCEDAGITRQFSAPYSPQQNGIVERRHRTMVEMTCCFLKEMNLPCSFWGEAICDSAYILNRLPTRTISGSTP